MLCIGLTAIAAGIHLVSFRTQQLSPPAYRAVLLCASQREPRFAVSHSVLKIHILKIQFDIEDNEGHKRLHIPTQAYESMTQMVQTKTYYYHFISLLCRYYSDIVDTGRNIRWMS